MLNTRSVLITKSALMMATLAFGSQGLPQKIELPRTVMTGMCFPTSTRDRGRFPSVIRIHWGDKSFFTQTRRLGSKNFITAPQGAFATPLRRTEQSPCPARPRKAHRALAQLPATARPKQEGILCGEGLQAVASSSAYARGGRGFVGVGVCVVRGFGAAG
jgi:hypothetical protein